MSEVRADSVTALASNGRPADAAGGGFSPAISLEIKWKQDGPEVLTQHNKMETQTGKRGLKLIT